MAVIPANLIIIQNNYSNLQTLTIGQQTWLWYQVCEFHKTLVKETSTSKPRLQEPKVDLEKIYKRFTKSKKEITVQDLQKEIKDTKSEVRNLRQELVILRVDHGLMDLRVKDLENTSHQGNEDRISL